MSRARAKRMLDFCQYVDPTEQSHGKTSSKTYSSLEQNSAYKNFGHPEKDNSEDFSEAPFKKSSSTSDAIFLNDGQDLILFKNRLRNKTVKNYKEHVDEEEQNDFSPDVSEYSPTQDNDTASVEYLHVTKKTKTDLYDNSSNSLITPQDLGFTSQPNIIIPETPEALDISHQEDSENGRMFVPLSISEPPHIQNMSSVTENNACHTTDNVTTEESSLALSSPSSSIKNKKEYPVKTNPGRKRKKDPSLWKCNILKKMKNTGQGYINSKGKTIKKREMKPGCSEKCIRNCKKNMSQECRQQLFQTFWELGNHESQLQYIFNLVQKVDKKVEKVIKEGKSRRSCTYQYYLPSQKGQGIKNCFKNNTIQVCKKTFLNTFDITDMWLTTMFKKFDRDDTVIFKDMRGKHTNRPNKLSEHIKESVRSHIRQVPTKESHYVRKRTSKLYFDESLNFSKLYSLYIEWMKENSETDIATKDQYRFIFHNEFNIDFFQPKKDRCLTCESHHTASEETNNTEQIKYALHLANKTVVRFLKDNHKVHSQRSKNIITACYDFQKVLSTPQSEISSFYYKRKFSVYNFTIFDIGNSEGFCYIYDETIGKKGPNEICSSLYTFIQEHVVAGATDFNFYSDCCGGQNRNRTVLAFYSFMCAKFNINITHNFFEVGHSQSEGDSMHALIERKKKNQTIYVPSQWVTLIKCAKSAGKPYKVTELPQDEIYDFKKLIDNQSNFTLRATETSGEKVMWSKIQCLRFTKELPELMEFQYDYYSDASKVLKVNPKKSKRMTRTPTLRNVTQENPNSFWNFFSLRPAYTNIFPISFEKFTDLNSLCRSGAIPFMYRDFYKNLPHINPTTGRGTGLSQDNI